MENGLEKIPGYYSSTDKNGAGVDEVGVREIQESERKEREIEGEKRDFSCLFFINKITFVQIYVNNSVVCAC